MGSCVLRGMEAASAILVERAGGPDPGESGARATRSGDELAPERWRELFGRLAAGRREALGELYELAAGRLYGLALWRTGDPADAEEVVQEVFVRLAETPRRLAKIRDPLGWLLTVTRRAAVDRTRRRRVRATEPLESCRFLAAPGFEPERALDAERASEELGRLPAAQREVLFLRHFAGLTFAAIARIVGAPTFTVASRHRLGIARLRRLFEEESP